MKKSLKSIISIFLLLITLVCSSLVNVTAATATGSSQTKTVYGIAYTFYAQAVTNSNGAIAYTNVSAGGQFGTGYVGINSRLYNSSGTLVASRGWVYNSSPGYSWYCPGSSINTAGTYYAKGQVSFYNGNGYTTYTCTSSPNVQVYSLHNPIQYQVNEDGLTFGSDYLASSVEECPDLVKVKGENGNIGYVYNTEFYPEINNPLEALSYINSHNTNYIIPVYESDGKTVIDYFEITVE